MNISRRLNRLADMVTEGSRLADVGTDHGYVPLCLCGQKRIQRAIAMDVNQGPLERAKAHIREAGMEGQIETRLSDGLTALRAGEADTILIAGMGGPLTIRILREGAHALPGVKELILQPQSEIGEVRRFLRENGWQIVREDILQEDGKYYPMFRAVPAEALESCSEEEYRFGKTELQESPQVLLEFLEKRIRVNESICAGLPEGDEERIRERKREVEQELALLQKVRTCLEKRQNGGSL